MFSVVSCILKHFSQYKTAKLNWIRHTFGTCENRRSISLFDATSLAVLVICNGILGNQIRRIAFATRGYREHPYSSENSLVWLDGWWVLKMHSCDMGERLHQIICSDCSSNAAAGVWTWDPSDLWDDLLNQCKKAAILSRKRSQSTIVLNSNFCKLSCLIYG